MSHESSRSNREGNPKTREDRAVPLLTATHHVRPVLRGPPKLEDRVPMRNSALQDREDIVLADCRLRETATSTSGPNDGVIRRLQYIGVPLGQWLY
jgi:hypothetical protein